ncbi:hypothetical protein BDN70DRAFT_853969 [Pholiota conissans]|uniref:Heterokaryon incompatibility domain-containing protein n=1 Tax=Pholiota conissans TaxID=109636 RepID=A0A9P6D326_9AGAR|nr:hypothetical protein BDN70DRAFT_853969 [Pholiota conissans]
MEYGTVQNDVPVYQGHDTTPLWLTAQDQALSRALQEFIMLLIQSSNEAKQEMDERSLNIETAKLIKALKGFISSFVGVSSSELAETKIKIDVDNDNVNEEVMSSKQAAVNSSPGDKLNELLLPKAKYTLERPQYTIEEKLLGALQDRVYNRMPIRLLSFEQYGPSLQISLLDRSAVFKRIESILRNELLPWDLSVTATKDVEDTIDYLLFKHATYAILSHTWLRSIPGEVTYIDWINGRFENSDPGYQKLVNFSKVALTEHKLSFGWMDTVCINKESSSELDESIRSMYNWYERANVCIIYLAETDAISDIHHDPWFSRGWTLQELLAPIVVKFYNKNWDIFIPESDNDKPLTTYPNHQTKSEEIINQIHKATTISSQELAQISNTTISRRMQLAASRIVTREEDIAYSLMGIFDVSIATAYGEGAERAFSRLLQEIFNSTSIGINDLFNWAGGESSSRSCILPANPQQYLVRNSTLDFRITKQFEPSTLTHAGIRIPLLLMPGISHIKGRNPDFQPYGHYSAIVNISPHWNRLYGNIPTTYRLLHSAISGLDGQKDAHEPIHQYTFAVFNVEPRGQSIYIPSDCIAFPIECREHVGKVTSTGPFYRIHTKEPVVFKLEKQNTQRVVLNDKDGFVLALDDLKKHGMQFLIKYV